MSGRATFATDRFRFATPATMISVSRTSLARSGVPVPACCDPSARSRVAIAAARYRGRVSRSDADGMIQAFIAGAASPARPLRPPADQRPEPLGRHHLDSEPAQLRAVRVDPLL